MIDHLRYTLLGDGSSDQALLPVLTWLLRQNRVARVIEPLWADLRRARRRPKTLRDRLQLALYWYPCDVLFIHRDAENQDYRQRISEIETAVDGIRDDQNVPPFICVVPVRMQEAWLLFNEIAIRKAAGNPSGRSVLTIPPVNTLEGVPDPKRVLHDALRTASELQGRRLKQFKPDVAAQRLASEYIDDFSPLYHLPAFSRLRNDVAKIAALNTPQ